MYNYQSQEEHDFYEGAAEQEALAQQAAADEAEALAQEEIQNQFEQEFLAKEEAIILKQITG